MSNAFRPDNEPTEVEDTPLYLEAIKEALLAARESLKASQKIDDQQGVIKASRAISDISSRLLSAGNAEKQRQEDNNARNNIIKDIISILEQPILDYADLEKRKLVVNSVKQGELTRQRTMYGEQETAEELISNTLNEPIPAPETHRNTSIASPDLGSWEV